MSEFKKGDKVLVEAWVEEVLDFYSAVEVATYSSIDVGQIGDVPNDRIHRHPGVPVEDLLEELELCDRLLSRRTCLWTAHGEHCDCEALGRRSEFQWARRRAREAAQRPEYQEGDEVWARLKVIDSGPTPPVDGVRVEIPGTSEGFWVDLDDIRPAEEGE